MAQGCRAFAIFDIEDVADAPPSYVGDGIESARFAPTNLDA